MAWIELHQALPNHRKNLALADVLGVPPVYALGHLTAFWLWAIDNAPDGSLRGISARVVAFAAQWPGTPNVFVDALIQTGFLDEDIDGQCLTIHDWMDYAGQLVERRTAERERSRKRRASYISTTDGRPLVDQQTAVGTVPNPTVPYLTQPENERATNSAELVGAPSGDAVTLTEKLKCFQERLAVPKANKVAVVGDAFTELIGRKADYGRIGRILGKYDAPFEVIKLIMQIVPTWNGVDDPHDYLQKAVEAKRNGSRNGHANGRLNPIIKASELTPPTADDESADERIDDEGLTAEDRAAIREHERRLQFEVAYQIWWEEAEPYVTNGRAPPKPAPKARAAQVWR